VEFNSKAGYELRTWILFIVGVVLVFIFAWQKNPLNPWWTLIIGAFTCTAIIVSAVQAIAGGMSDAAKKALEEERERFEHQNKSEKRDEAANSVILGDRSVLPLYWIRRRHSATI